MRLAVAVLTALGMCVPAAGAAGAASPGARARPSIVGGDTASIAEYPYAVYLVDNAGRQFCGGALVGSTAVATAAHCTEGARPSDLRVVAGRQDMRSRDGVVARVSAIRIAPGYGDPTKGNDFAVLRLDRSMRYRPVDLPAQADGSLYAEGTEATVLGWGRTAEGGDRSQVLRKATVPVISDSGCSASYGVFDSVGMMCAGYPRGGTDACQGDSGGPLVVGDTLIGLVSWGQGCAQPGKPGVYTRIAAYADTIRAQSK
jgi:secreted trypsin-like serine protease